jgi:hypothetical protein
MNVAMGFAPGGRTTTWTNDRGILVWWPETGRKNSLESVRAVELLEEMPKPDVIPRVLAAHPRAGRGGRGAGEAQRALAGEFDWGKRHITWLVRERGGLFPDQERETTPASARPLHAVAFTPK